MTRILTILGAVMLIMQVLGAFRYVANEWKLWRHGRGPMMRTALLLTMLLSPSFAGAAQESLCTDATVIMCENWEDRATGTGDMGTKRPTIKSSAWALSGASTTNDATRSSGGGANSLRLNYGSGPGGSWGNGAGFLDQALGATYTDVYYRYYVYWENFQWSTIATKNMELFNGSGTSSHYSWFGSQSLPATSAKPKYTFGYASPYFEPAQNQSTDVTVTSGQWYCFETHLHMNSTTSTADGTLDGWVDGVLQFAYTGKILDATAPTVTGLMISGYWNCQDIDCLGAEDSHPQMYRYVDNIVISTARIGCLGSGTSGMYIMILKSLDGIGQWIGLGLSAGGLLMRQSVRAWMWRGALASMAALLCLGVGVKSRILLSSAYVRHQTITVAEKYLEHVTTKKG